MNWKNQKYGLQNNQSLMVFKPTDFISTKSSPQCVKTVQFRLIHSKCTKPPSEISLIEAKTLMRSIKSFIKSKTIKNNPFQTYLASFNSSPTSFSRGKRTIIITTYYLTKIKLYLS